VTAFYDDSGGFNPSSGKFACLGMIVVPAEYIRECGDSWWEVLVKYFRYSNLQTIGIEAKSSGIYGMLNRMKKSDILKQEQQIMFDNGLDTLDKINNLIEAIWVYLAKPPVSVKYLAVVTNKEEAWQEFRPTQLNAWKTLIKLGGSQKQKLKKLSLELESFLVKHTYTYLLQRLEYLGKDPDVNFSDAFVVGDQSSSTKTMLETQAGIQAGLGLGKFSDLPTIVNRPWFGSSLHDPCLQMADWIAFAVRKWAEGDSTRIKQLLPNFRGYPDPDRLLGRGIVLCPNKECFPELPLEEIDF
jgi:hypothetical protein